MHIATKKGFSTNPETFVSKSVLEELFPATDCG